MTREEAIRILASSCIPGSKQTEALETLIPELAESEDERIIRFLKHAATLDAADELFQEYGVKHTQVIAWLEKQKDINCLACDQHLKGYLAGRKVTEEEKQKEQKPVESISQLAVQGKGVYKICPRCKERMVRDDSMVYTSMPPQYRYECPKCGESECDTVMYDNPEMEEQKPAEWSEEDEKYLNRVINLWVNDFGEDSDTVKWLKSLRPSWKPNDEDEVRLINTSISFLKDFANKGYENAVECIDWLKSKLNGNSGK